MKHPKLGDTVITVGYHHNGTAIHPGIITRVWLQPEVNPKGPASTNVTVFLDGALPVHRASIPTYESLEKADQAKAAMPFCYLRDG